MELPFGDCREEGGGTLSELRWGIVGTGRIGTEKVIPAIQRAGNCEVVAIGSRTAERARAVADRLAIPHAVEGYDLLLAFDEVDAVYITLPNHLHKEWTIAAARAGKHVLCEKPLAMTADDAQEMVDECDAGGVRFMEAFMYRLHPSWERVRELVADGVIGTVRSVHSHFSYFNDDPQNIRNVAAFGGGALMDIGCYCVNLSRMIFDGEPIAASGSVRRDPRFGTDVITSALLEFEQGHATFTCSTQMEPLQTVEIVGTDGRIGIEIPFNIPRELGTRVFLTRGGNPPVSPDTVVIDFPPVDQYEIQAWRFAEAVLRGGEVPTPPSDGVQNMRVIEQILAAAV